MDAVVERHRRMSGGYCIGIDEIGPSTHEHYQENDDERHDRAIGYHGPVYSQRRYRIRQFVGFVCLVSTCVLTSSLAAVVSAQQYMDDSSTMKLRKQQPHERQHRNNSRGAMRQSRNLDSSSAKSGKIGKSLSSSKSGKSKSDKSSSITSNTMSPSTSSEQTITSTEIPSLAPSTTSSMNPSTSPTITDLPTVSPMESPSAAPTITLSSLPSFPPSITPSASPSIDVTSVPSSYPTIGPSMTPTSSPSISPSYGPTHQPSNFPSKSLQPTALPSVTASMLPSIYKSSVPSTIPSIAPSASPTSQVSLAPSSQPSINPTLVPTPIETEIPSSLPSVVPTIEISIETRQDLRMSLFGLPEGLLDTSQQQYYQLRTATYIEDFYNNDDGTNGILEAIKSEITNVIVTLTVESQEFDDDSGVLNGARMIPINEDNESYLPESAVANNYYHRNNNRVLQTPTQVTEPCVGTSALKIIFSLELSYQTPDMYQLDSNAIVFFPFSAVEFRTNYIDNYLKNPQFGGEAAVDNGNADEVFADVYCTSRVVDIADTESPTYSPSVSPSESTNIPSSSSSMPPSAGESEIPSLQSSASSIPSTRVPSDTVLPTLSPSSLSSVGPTFGLSVGPSTTTRPSTIAISTGPTTIPPSSVFPVGSTGPTLTIEPTVVIGSAGPNLSSFPSILVGSDTPTLIQGTLLPTSQQSNTVTPPSPMPTAVASNTTATPILRAQLPTQFPTTPLINPGSQIGYSMQLFGMSESLSQAEKGAWNSRTTSYILSYYNDYEGQGGIRGDIYGVEGYLVITSNRVVATRIISNEVVSGIARFNNNHHARFDDEWTYWNGAIDSEQEVGAGQDFHHVNSRSYDASPDVDRYVGEDHDRENDNEQLKRQHKNVVTKQHKGPRKFNPTAGNSRQLQGCGGANVLVGFAIALRYRNRGTTEWTLNQIVNEPLRTWTQRNNYKNNILKQPGDPVEMFAGLRCTGAITFPPDAQAVRISSFEKNPDTFQDDPIPKTSTSDLKSTNIAHNEPFQKSAEPSLSPVGLPKDTDDVFDDLRNVNRGKNERKCNTNMPTESLKEFELSFMYSIESSSNDVYEYTDDMESLILDIVASTVLICASQSDAHISQRSKRLDGGIRDSGAVRIRYPEYGEITSISDCDQIMMSSQAKSCAVMNTKLLVTSTSASLSEVHRTVLLALANSLNGNKMDESIPNLTATSYIGPDPESLTLSASLANNMIESRGASTTPVIAVSIGCSFLLLILALNLVFRRTSKAATAKHSPISAREEDIDDASDGPSVSYRDQIITNNS
ncbi:hypothetical protein ACHAWU_001880 [Discostella pseudostelligera]|uniref:Uncharacterized protein n=1 Tax=Discostella pseudostelligera TaxID=259834 RepID=A0ABD3MIA6_9STRA